MSTPSTILRTAAQRIEDTFSRGESLPFAPLAKAGRAIGESVGARIDRAVASGKPFVTKSTRATGAGMTRGQRIAKGMGWFGIGLGLVEILAGNALATSIGLENRTTTIRGFGLREIGAGVRVLKGNTRKGMWSRVLGDVMDIGLLASAYAKPSPSWTLRGGDVRTQKRIGTTLALAAVLGATALDVVGAIELERDMLGGF